MLGWGRQISENSGFTIAITAVTNCHRSSVNSKQKIYAMKLTAREICFSSRSFFTMDGRGFYYYNSSQLPVYFSNADYSQYVYSQGQSCSPEEATIGTIDSPSQNPASSSSPELVELSGPSSSSPSAEERRLYARWSYDEEKLLLRLWAENFDPLESRELTRHTVLKVIFADVNFSLSW